MSDLAVIVSAAIGAIGPVGAGLAVVWREVKKMQKEVEACKAHRTKDQERMRLTIAMSWQMCTSGPPPRNRAVQPLAHLLRGTFDIHEPLPSDWLKLLDEIEAKHSRIKAEKSRTNEGILQ